MIHPWFPEWARGVVVVLVAVALLAVPFVISMGGETVNVPLLVVSSVVSALVTVAVSMTAAKGK